MTALLLGMVSALLLGVSDFCAARSARRIPSLTATRTAALAGTALAPLLLVVRPVDLAPRDVLLAVASGVFMSVGLALLYHGYSVARMGVVAPLSSVLLASVPVAWDVIGGTRPSALSATGMTVGVLALALTSYTPQRVEGAMVSHSPTLGPLLGIGSGLAFGAAYTMMSGVSDAAGLSTVLFQRLTGLVLLVSFAALRDEPLVAPPGVARWYAIGTGATGVTAIGALQWAFQAGKADGGSMTGPVSVASSQFATVAVILSVVFNRERMRWWQAVGVVSTAAAVAMIALG